MKPRLILSVVLALLGAQDVTSVALGQDQAPPEQRREDFHRANESPSGPFEGTRSVDFSAIKAFGAMMLLAQEGGGNQTGIELERPERPTYGRGRPVRGMRQHRGDMVRVLDDAVVRPNESVPELVTVMGDARVEGEVRGDAVVVMGSATITGRVNGDLVVVMGGLKLGDNAQVNGDVVVVGGRLEEEPGAQINGERRHFGFGNLGQDFVAWFRSGFLLARPLPPSVPLGWSLVGLHFLIYLIIAVLIPRPVAVCAEELRLRLGPCFLVGLLGLVLSVPLTFILLATGVGVFLLPLLLLVLTGTVFLGKTASLEFLGEAVCQRFSDDVRPTPLFALLIGSALVTLFYMVPLLGGVVWAVMLPLGLGAALLALAEAFRRSGENDRDPTTALGNEDLSSGARFALDSTLPSTERPAPSKRDSGPMSSDQSEPLGAASDETGAPPAESARPAWTPGAPGPILASASSFTPGDLAVMPRVGFWMRLVATFLDFILLIWVLPVAQRWFIPVWIAYHVGMWVWKGTTIGGIVCGLKVIRLDGRPVDISVAVVRSLGSVFSLAAAGIGFFWAGWSPDKQAWHDRIAGTAIVKLPKGVSLV